MSSWPSVLSSILTQNIPLPARNLAGWWSGNTAGDYAAVAYDTSGYARHGVITSATSGTGVSGKCFVFGGSQYVTLTDVDAQAFTFAFWVKTSGSSDLADKYGSAGQRSWVIKLTSGAVVFQISEAGTTVVDFTGTTDIADNAWHHVACVYSAGSFVKIFIDGQLDLISYDEPAAIKESSASIRIGIGPNDSMTGSMDEVRLYTAALSASDVYALYVTPSPYEALPEYPDQNGYSETPQNGTVRGETDIGPGKTRQRFTSLATYMAMTYWLSSVQRLILDDFYKRILRGGSLAFTWTHPDGYSVSARFTKPPAYTPQNQFVSAAVELEVLP